MANGRIPLAKFSAQSHIVNGFDGFDLTVQIRELGAPVQDEATAIALAWTHLSRSLQRRGWNVVKMARNLPG